MDLLSRILAYCRRADMSATRFGRVVVNDPRFVEDLRNGRQPRISTSRRVGAWLDRQDDVR